MKKNYRRLIMIVMLVLLNITVNAQSLIVFPCDSKLYVSQLVSGTTELSVMSVTNAGVSFGPSIGPFFDATTPFVPKYNSTGLDPVSRLMWGISTDGDNNLIRIDGVGNHIKFGSIVNLPAPPAIFSAGEFDISGNYYVKQNTSNSVIYKLKPQYMASIATPINLVDVNGLPVNVNLPDMAYHVGNNKLYGVEVSNGNLVSIDLNPATLGRVNIIGGGTSSGGTIQYGAMFGSPTGIFGLDVFVSGLVKFDITTGSRVLIHGTSSLAGIDGAHCSTAPISLGADLTIVKDDAKASYVPGTTNTYTVIVTNKGPFDASGATVSDLVPAGISSGDFSYSVPVVTGGATTSITSAQTGALNDVVNLPVGGTITYTINVAIPSSYTGNLVNVATVTSPANSTDLYPENNTATDIDFSPCAISAINPDSDGDGISDYCDLDDDNDGILDVTEGVVDNDGVLEWSYNGTGDTPSILNSTVISSAQDATKGSGLIAQIVSGETSYSVTGVSATTISQSISNNSYFQFEYTTANFPNTMQFYYDRFSLWVRDPDFTPNYKVRLYLSTDNFATSTDISGEVSYPFVSGDQRAVFPLTSPYKLAPNKTYTLRLYFYNVTGGASATINHDDFQVLTTEYADADSDGIPNHLDLDSDNDGCVDALEGDENVSVAQLADAIGTVTVGAGSTAAIKNIGGTVDANGVPVLVNSGGAADTGSATQGTVGQPLGSSQNAIINPCCINPPNLEPATEFTKTGISNLEGFANGWPGNVPNGFIAIESKNKGFVITRVATVADIPTTDLVEGMLVYDIAAACVKLYNGTTWKCLAKSCQ